LEGWPRIPNGFPGQSKVEMAATLLLVKYCLLGGDAAAAAMQSSDT